jgi:DNA-binding MarR family transcriptional regulator
MDRRRVIDGEGALGSTADDFGLIGGLLGYQLHRTDLMMMDLLAEALAEFGLTAARATGLVYVALHEGCDQTALGTALGINRASTVALVNALVGLGAIERRPGRDRRSNSLWLTETGGGLKVQSERITSEHDAMVFGVLTDEESETLRRLLRKLRDRNPEA